MLCRKKSYHRSHVFTSLLITELFFNPQMGYTDRREVKQFQYTAWPDHGVPEHPAPFLQFLRRIVAMNTPDAGPVITHCR